MKQKVFERAYQNTIDLRQKGDYKRMVIPSNLFAEVTSTKGILVMKLVCTQWVYVQAVGNLGLTGAVFEQNSALSVLLKSCACATSCGFVL